MLLDTVLEFYFKFLFNLVKMVQNYVTGDSSIKILLNSILMGIVRQHFANFSAKLMENLWFSL